MLTRDKNDSYFRLDLREGDCKIDGCSAARNWEAASRYAPADTVPVPGVILQVVCADHVDTVQPIVLVFPHLYSHSKTHHKHQGRIQKYGLGGA